MAFAKEKQVIAIDISDGLVKIVAVSGDRAEKTVHILDCAALVSDKEKDIAKYTRSILSKYKAGKLPVLVSFPRHLVTIRSVRFPAAKPDEIKKMAELQAVKYLPYSLDEIVVAHKVIGATKDGYSDIMLVLAQRKLVAKYIAIFKYAGIPIDALVLSSEGILNWYSMLNAGDTTPAAIIDCGRRHTQIHIIRDKKFLFSRSISFDITKAGSSRNALLREIKMSFDSYLKETKEGIAHIIVTGSEDYAKEFSAFLGVNIQKPCEYKGQLQNIALKDEAAKCIDKLKNGSYTHLLGIAFQPEKLSTNLLPKDVIEKKRERLFKNELITSVILLLSVMTAAFGIVEKKITEKRQYLKKIESRLREIEPEAKKLLKQKESTELIKNQLILEGSSVDIIREVYEILPENVSLTLFEFEDKNRALLRGTAKELSIVFNLLPVLEKSDLFKNAKINYATKRTFKKREFADFEIVCGLKRRD